MKLKEKAEELVNKYDETLTYLESKEKAKQCALIAVEFAREEFRNHCAAEIDTEGSPDDHFNALTQEIKKL
jgi:hypothetical protein